MSMHRGWSRQARAGRLRMTETGLAALALAVLAGCGGGSGAVSDPMQPYREQAVNWTSCGDTIDVIVDPELKKRLSCATIRVPLDYSAPERGDAVVAISRVTASVPTQRQGAILVNPGGPGGDGLALSMNLAALWENASDETAVGQSLRAIPQRYDLIGFSPRGVGASSRLYCANNGILRPVRHSSDRSEDNVAAMLFNANALGDACLRNPMVKYVNTDSTARDMDLVRELLGDAKFNYYGISYGTWLGVWYASLFPERVGRMVLDSSMDVTGNIDVNLVLQPKSMQHVLDSFIPSYAARHPDHFAIGTDAASIAAIYRALPEPMRVAFGKQASSHAILNRTANVVKGAQLLSAARGMHQIFLDNPGIEDDPVKLEEVLLEYPFAPESFGDDIEIRGLAQSMVKPYFEARDPQSQPIEMGPSSAVFHTVVCNDTVATSTESSYWVDLGNQMAASYPYEGGSVTNNECVNWGGPSVSRPALSRAAQTGPILMLQTEFDALTATEGALRSFASLPQAHMTTLRDYYTHGLVSLGVECVNEKIGRYFADGVVAGRSSTCEGPKLPYDGETQTLSRMAKTAAPEEEDAAAQARAALNAQLDAMSAQGLRF
ncbi:Tripeptidyl aminopeptidase precursor [Pigmentiphaga humi]|uniref:Tripeptidyl aminopeptidase n=1 Tax=Pigmentiphaga humi TaxID=2478468 RepID=A0A3P4AZQ6_9BURK|nr:alpha/beta fold hydrolase [Pigmentiphaga humi]VCU69051.1 Tripeptidyl aminopeptidase precursor [Pigmentiphaga humi]